MRSRRGITNNQDTPALLTDARDLSSFHPAEEAFRPCDATQLRDILEYRVEQAFYPNALSDEVIPLCAALSAQRNGDAHCALDLLSTAADQCEEEGRTTVTEEDARRAERLAEVSLRRREVVRLSPHQKVLLESVYARKKSSLILKFIGNLTILYNLVVVSRSRIRRFPFRR